MSWWWVAATVTLVLAALAVHRVGRRLEAERAGLERALDRLGPLTGAAADVGLSLRRAARDAADRRRRLAAATGPPPSPPTPAAGTGPAGGRPGSPNHRR